MINAPLKKYSAKIRQKRLSRASYNFFDPSADDRVFYPLLLSLGLVAWLLVPYPRAACWFGFLVSSYGVISNDSIQTLGIFITANAHRTAWWLMWGFISLVFFLTVGYSWFYYGGDVSYHRLDALGLAARVEAVHLGQLLAPILLLLLTHLRLPVSTTFLLLSTFAPEVGAVGKIVFKSVVGYGVAFVASFIVWYVADLIGYEQSSRKPHKGWFLFQWGSSALLWMAWVIQDGANMVAFLPRPLSLLSFLGFVGFVVLFLGLLFYTRGNRLQEVVNQKTGITDIRSATNANLFYMLLLFAFVGLDTVPMSTTWLFIGLLGGRELAIGVRDRVGGNLRKSLFLIGRDLCYAVVGLLISLLLSLLTNPSLAAYAQRLISS